MVMIVSEQRMPDIDAVLGWLSSIGYPMTHGLSGHLMVWSGRLWTIKRVFDTEVVNLRYEIDIQDDGLSYMFRMRWS